MTTEVKIFLSIVFAIIFVFGFLNFEIAIDSHNISIANQQIIDSLEHRVDMLEIQLEEISQKHDTIIIKNYITVKK